MLGCRCEERKRRARLAVARNIGRERRRISATRGGRYRQAPCSIRPLLMLSDQIGKERLVLRAQPFVVDVHPVKHLNGDGQRVLIDAQAHEL